MASVWRGGSGKQQSRTQQGSDKTGFLDNMCDACSASEQGADLRAFRDSAYPLHSYMYRIPPEGSLTRLECCFNAHMARFRISIENVFAEAGNYSGTLNHLHNLRLGSMAVGKMFPLAILFKLYNIHCILYGNQAAAQFEGESMLLEVTFGGVHREGT
jgi:hypothetical protein